MVKKANEISLEDILAVHEGGKLSIEGRYPLNDVEMLSKVYTPGVAKVCKLIEAEPQMANRYTTKSVAVVTDGTAVLGLGDIGAVAGLPVMEGKANLFKAFAGVNAFPILLNTKNVDEIVQTVINIAPSFAGINLEDIAAPRCFEIEARLKEALNIPVFHDDQHGTAVVTLAGLFNALKVVNKKMEDISVVINGAGAAGNAIARLLKTAGVTNIILCDSKGAIYEGRENLDPEKTILAMDTNPQREKGSLSQVIKGKDVFVGVSVRDVLTVDDVRNMAEQPIVFAMANPDPEISPELIADIAAVIATGRSDYPNQLNNVLCFPGLFKGLFEVNAVQITKEMLLAAAKGIADIVTAQELSAEYIIPSPFNPKVADSVARAVAAEAIKANG